MNKIEEYDKQLVEDIRKLKRHISEEEELAREYMQIYGAPERVVEKVIQKAHSGGRRISFTGDASSVNHLAKWLNDMTRVYEAFPFRIRMGYFMSTKMHVIMEDSWLFFNTCMLTDDERREYAKYWQATFRLNYVSKEAGVYNYYPTSELMRFISQMLVKYKAEDVLSKDEYVDEKMRQAWDALEWNYKRE